MSKIALGSMALTEKLCMSNIMYACSHLARPLQSVCIVLSFTDWLVKYTTVDSMIIPMVESKH